MQKLRAAVFSVSGSSLTGMDEVGGVDLLLRPGVKRLAARQHRSQHETGERIMEQFLPAGIFAGVL